MSGIDRYPNWWTAIGITGRRVAGSLEQPTHTERCPDDPQHYLTELRERPVPEAAPPRAFSGDTASCSGATDSPQTSPATSQCPENWRTRGSA